MKLKRILLILMCLFLLVGCTNLKDTDYDTIINNLTLRSKKANIYRKGYQFYTPNTLRIKDAGSNYAILDSNDVTYYLYIDFINYLANENNYEIDKNAYYARNINFNNKKGYVEINLQENNQYLIEIMYNYAKIEVMVEENKIKEVLVNTISILNSVKYNDDVIEELLSSDNLDYTEEPFKMFEQNQNNSNTLDYEEDNTPIEDENEIVDTDYIN